MKKQLLRLLLPPAIVCAIMSVGFLSVASLAHAATSQASATASQVHTTQPAYTLGENCPFGDAEMDDTAQAFFCFSKNATYDSDLFCCIVVLNSGSHTMIVTWVAQNGVEFSSKLTPGTLWKGPFDGSSTMLDVLTITLS